LRAMDCIDQPAVGNALFSDKPHKRLGHENPHKVASPPRSTVGIVLYATNINDVRRLSLGMAARSFSGGFSRCSEPIFNSSEERTSGASERLWVLASTPPPAAAPRGAVRRS
jgi:hypothetical protein